jgi:hypothetical protein
VKKKILISLLILIIVTTSLFAAEPRKGVGVGLTTGIPFHIGPTVEYNFGPATASLALGYMGQGAGANFFHLRLGGDYNFSTPFIQNDWDLDLYLSVGGQLDLGFTKGATLIGIGIPVTWAWYMESLPLKFYAKAGPVVEIFNITGWGSSVGLGFFGSAGALYYF